MKNPTHNYAIEGVVSDRDEPGWVCDWEPDDLNSGPECPYCAGEMCARFDNLNCTHDIEERHGYRSQPVSDRDEGRREAQVRAIVEAHFAVCDCPFDGSDPDCNLALTGTQLGALLASQPVQEQGEGRE